MPPIIRFLYIFCFQRTSPHSTQPGSPQKRSFCGVVTVLGSVRRICILFQRSAVPYLFVMFLSVRRTQKIIPIMGYNEIQYIVKFGAVFRPEYFYIYSIFALTQSSVSKPFLSFGLKGRSFMASKKLTAASSIQSHQPIRYRVSESIVLPFTIIVSGK